MEAVRQRLHARVGEQVGETKASNTTVDAMRHGRSQWVRNRRASVRPTIPYGFFLLLVLIDIGLFVHGVRVGASFDALAVQLWDEGTQALFASIIAFHFGGRAFGK